jgi:hypothetical protein
MGVGSWELGVEVWFNNLFPIPYSLSPIPYLAVIRIVDPIE